MIDDPLAVFLTLAVIVYLSIWLEPRSRIVRALSSVLTAILIAAVASNLGLLPSTSATYDALGGFGVNVGIALVLLGVDVKTVRRAGPAMLAAFGLGAVGTALGAILGALVVSGWLGPETWKLAGQYTGTYTGGGVNFVAVGRVVDTSSDLYAAAIAADNVTTTIWVAICLVIPTALARWWPAAAPAPASTVGPSVTPDDSREVVRFNQTQRPVSIADAAALVTIAIGSVWVAGRLGDLTPGVPSVLWLTTIVLIVAQIPAVQGVAGGPLWGNYVMHLFLATIGAQSILAEIMRVGPVVFYFTLIVVGVHGAVLLGVGRLFRLDLPTLALASQANVGGPASAMALATSRGYADLVVPAVAIGLLGYAVGNYTGLAVAHLMLGILGG